MKSTQPKFNIGDWCFCEFILQQVQKTEDNRITSVSDGFFNLSSSDLTDRCFPLDMAIKVISDDVRYWSKRFHELNHNSLNHPDLNRFLIKTWVEMCDSKDDKDKLKSLYDKLNNFGNDLCRKVRDLQYEEIEGVSIFRR